MPLPNPTVDISGIAAFGASAMEAANRANAQAFSGFSDFSDKIKSQNAKAEQESKRAEAIAKFNNEQGAGNVPFSQGYNQGSGYSDVISSYGSPNGATKNDLLKFIYAGEGGYNSSNNGTQGNSIVGSTHQTNIGGKALTDMSISEIMSLQSGDRSQGRKLFAVGAPQFIPETLQLAVKESGIDPNTRFTPEVQDALAMQLLKGSKRPKLASYLNGKSDDLNSAALELAMEWASVPDPRTGSSFYGNGNKSSHKVQDVLAALQAARGQ